MPPPDRARSANAMEGGADAVVAILDELRRGRAATRPQLSHNTGIGRGVVAKSVAQLIERDLVEERGTGPSSGGRAPRLLRFRADAGHLLAADVGVTSVTVAIADLAGRVLRHREEPADLTAGPDVVLGIAHDLFSELRGSGQAPGTLWGIGIGVPGPVDFAAGRCSAPPVPGWEEFRVREYFAERHGVPVWVDNEVNAMALGELRAGAATGRENVVFVKVGTWIGGALISGGRLHRGAGGGAGEFGHLRVTDDPDVVCRCGRIGCLAALAGGAALQRDGKRLAHAGKSEHLAAVLERDGGLEAADVARAARLGDAECRALIVRNGRDIGRALAMVINIFNPSQIVIGGGVAQAGDELLAAIREVIYAQSLPVATRDLVIDRTALPGVGGVTGAAVMASDELFAPGRIRAWVA